MVDILLGWAHSRDWAAALNSAVPTRKRTAGETGDAAPEPSAAAKPINAATEPAAAAAAAASEAAEAAVSQPDHAAAAKTALAAGEPAHAASQPSGGAAGAASAAREDADGDAKGRGHADVGERQHEGAGVDADAQQTGKPAKEPSAVEGEQPCAPATAVSEAATTPHSAADDKRHGDESVHTAKRQKTEAES